MMPGSRNNVPVVIRKNTSLVSKIASQLNPNSLMTFLDTSAMRTRRFT